MILLFNASSPVISRCRVVVGGVLLADLTGYILTICPTFDDIVIPK
jgi:hypothetical protein